MHKILIKLAKELETQHLTQKVTQINHLQLRSSIQNVSNQVAHLKMQNQVIEAVAYIESK